jgi:hypothetical protein
MCPGSDEIETNSRLHAVEDLALRIRFRYYFRAAQYLWMWGKEAKSLSQKKKKSGRGERPDIMMGPDPSA